MPLSRTETRALAQDHPHVRADATYARLIMRRISPPVTYAVVRWTGLSADAVTWLAIASGLGAAAIVLFQSAAAFLLAVVLLQAAYLFDTVDGEVARVRGTAGKRGAYLDLMGHVVQNRALFAACSVVLLDYANGAGWAIAIVFAGLALASPYGEQARAQIVGNASGVPSEHGGGSGAALPSGRSLFSTGYRLYRRVAFLWAYPASMNLFCLALVGDAARLAIEPAAVPIIVPIFTAGFLATLALKQTLNAVRLLDRRLWAHE